MVSQIIKPGVVLSFDDHFIFDWLDVTDLFEKFNARVTFFIHAPDKLNEEQWEGLNVLVSKGHAVGCHSLRHEKAIDYCKTKTTEQWVSNEVRTCLEMLQNRGFDITSFAYPCSQNDVATDNAIKPFFKHARTGAFLAEGKRFVDLDNIFKPVKDVADCFLFPAKGIDRVEDVSLIDEAASRAAKQNELLFLLGHRIGVDEDGKDNLHLTNKYVLEKILKIIKSHDLTFYTFNDLP